MCVITLDFISFLWNLEPWPPTWRLFANPITRHSTWPIFHGAWTHASISSAFNGEWRTINHFIPTSMRTLYSAACFCVHSPLFSRAPRGHGKIYVIISSLWKRSFGAKYKIYYKCAFHSKLQDLILTSNYYIYLSFHYFQNDNNDPLSIQRGSDWVRRLEIHCGVINAWKWWGHYHWPSAITYLPSFIDEIHCPIAFVKSEARSNSDSVGSCNK